MRMNPRGLISSSTTQDLEKFNEELRKVFEVMHIANTERVDLDAYQLKGIAFLELCFIS